MQEHIDTTQVVGRDIDFLPIKAVSDGILTENLFRFQQQRTRAAGGIVNLVDFGLARPCRAGSAARKHRPECKELAAGLACPGCVHGHQIFIGIAKGINISDPLHRRGSCWPTPCSSFARRLISLCDGRTQLVAVHVKIIEQPGENRFQQRRTLCGLLRYG